MNRQADRTDLTRLEVVDNKLAEIRISLRALTHLDGVTNALAILDQLDEAISDIGASIEMKLHEQKGR